MVGLQPRSLLLTGATGFVGGAVRPAPVDEPPRRILLVARTSFLTSVDQVRVKAAGSGSIVTYDAKLTLNGPRGLLDPFLRLAFRRIGDRAAAGLNRVLSGEAAAG